MSGPLDDMSSLAVANSEASLQQKLRAPDLWRRLQLFRLAVMSSSSGESLAADGGEKRRKLALGLLKDVELRLLFLAVDFCHGQAGDETKQGVVEVALLSVLGSSVGQELLREVCCFCTSNYAWSLTIALCTYVLLQLRFGVSNPWPGAVYIFRSSLFY